MRLRITRKLDGSIDGIQLGQFVPGLVYEVGTAVGSYLLSIEAAEPAGDSLPNGSSFEQQLFRAGHGSGSAGAAPADAAADQDPRTPRPKRGR